MPTKPSATHGLTSFDAAGLNDVDVSRLGGGTTPFVTAASLIDVPFILEDAQYVEVTQFGPKYFAYIRHYESDNTQIYAVTFTPRSPAFAQLRALADNLRASGAIYPVGPLTLERQGKSYRFAPFHTEDGAK